MDGQNFENENNVTVDTTATEVSSTAEPVQEPPVNNYQDYTAKCTATGNNSISADRKQGFQCTGYRQPGTGYSFYRSRMLYRMDRCTVWNRWYHLCCICQQAG